MAYDLTQNELDAPGGMSTQQGGYMSAYNAPLPSPTVAPAPKPAPVSSPVAPAPVAPKEPTIAETLTGIKNEALRVQDILNQQSKPKGSATGLSYDQGKSYAELYPAINEKQIQRNQMKMFQAEINATNKVYDEMLNRERLAGQGRLGSQRAAGARGGLLGSDFGASQEDAVVGLNNSNQNLVQQERNAKVGEILGKVRSAVTAEIAAKRKARGEDADTYIAYLASSKERKANNVNIAATALLNANLDPATMTPDELQAIAKEGGLSTQDILQGYQALKQSSDAASAEGDLKTRKTEAEITKLNDRSFDLSEGQARYDEEGNIIASRAKTYAPSSGGGGAGGGSSINLTPDNKRTLLGGGYSEGDIATLEAGVRSEGLTEILRAEKEAGASPQQLAALKDAYGASQENTEQFLSKDYFSKIFTTTQLEKSAAEAGFGDLGEGLFNLKDVDTAGYLDYLDGVIQQYRSAGYTDQEILKQMQ